MPYASSLNDELYTALQCYVAGAPNCFLVDINPTETSSHLLELIIENELPDYRANDLDIFKVRRLRTSCGRWY